MVSKRNNANQRPGYEESDDSDSDDGQELEPLEELFNNYGDIRDLSLEKFEEKVFFLQFMESVISTHSTNFGVGYKCFTFIVALINTVNSKIRSNFSAFYITLLKDQFKYEKLTNPYEVISFKISVSLSLSLWCRIVA